MSGYGKRDEDADGVVMRVDRTAVFQEARVFNSSPVSPRKCRTLLTKIVLLLSSGEKFPTNEATTLFFGISKLFQNKDASLRQMVYLVIKELADTAEDVIMVTSSIMKDCQVGSDIVFRPNAIRALCRIIDASTIPAIERIIKVAIIDKVPSVSSAALVSSYHLLPVAKDIVRRWQNEVQEAATASKSSGFSLGFGSSHSAQIPNTSYNSQYHAIGLLYQIRSHDRMALVKMVQQYSQAGVVKNPAATMLLVRLAAKLAHDDPGLRPAMSRLLDAWLRHKSELVNFEAAKAICDLPDVTDTEVNQAIHVLQLFLGSPRPVTKFAAIRVLHSFAAFKPDAVGACNQDIEALVNHSNRSIGTFAISTLLKTCNETSVDRLMKQISQFMSEISDDFKVTIVEAIRTLAIKFPSKHASIFTFLSQTLREEGGYEFKRAVVESIFDLIKFVPDSKEDALAHLAEFIEDCEFTKLAVRILHLLGMQGPKTKTPTKYIRYIYNRVVLENSIVRAAAVTALGKFGLSDDAEVKSSIRVLLTRCLDDVDDEVRDRAAMNLKLIQEDHETATRFIRNDSMFSLPTLEHQLVMYVTADGRDTFAAPFDLSTIPVVTREQADADERAKKLTAATPTLKVTSAGPKQAPKSATEAAALAAETAQKFAAQLGTIGEIAAYGDLLKSSPVVELTESETEYVVKVIKHVFKEHLVLQFDITNTLPDTILTDVSIVSVPVDSDDADTEAGFEEDFLIPAATLSTNEPGTVYVAFKNTSTDPYSSCSFTNMLKFTSKEIDPSTGEPEETGYEDEYQVEDVEIGGPDWVVPAFAPSWEAVWDETSGGDEASETLVLGASKSIMDTVEQLIQVFQLQPLDASDVALSNSTHTLKLYGKSIINSGKVAVQVRMAYQTRTGVTVKIQARSEEEGIATALVNSIA